MGTSGTEPKQAQSSLLGAADGGFPFGVVWRGETCTFPIFPLCEVSSLPEPTDNSEVEPLLTQFFLQKRLYFFLPVFQKIAVCPAMVQQSCLLPGGSTCFPSRGLEKHCLPARSTCWLSTVNL